MNAKTKVKWSIRVTLMAVLAGLVGFVGWQRGSARAGVDDLIQIPKYGGGFLTVGICKDKPGLIALSRRKPEHAEIHATMHPLTGKTVVRIDLDGEVHEFPLADPTAILIPESGPPEFIPIAWNRETFDAVLLATDCSEVHADSTEHPLCGRPFYSLEKYLQKHPSIPAPKRLLEFAHDEDD